MKISCDVIRDLLPLYVEDMLSNDSKNIVDEHIEQCESCRDELKNYQEMKYIAVQLTKLKIKVSMIPLIKYGRG